MMRERMAWRAVAAAAAVTSLGLASAAGPAAAASGSLSTRDGVYGAAVPGNSPAWGRKPRPVTAYVTNNFSGTVTPIRTAVNKAGVPIPAGSSPSAIAITP
jgi:hypothetical protein